MNMKRGESNKDSEQLRAEVESTRAEVASDIAALGERLTPQHTAHEVKGRARKAARRVMTGARERTENAARIARERSADAGEYARHNAVPLALIGAGVAWFVVQKSRTNGNASDIVEAGAGERFSEAEQRWRARGSELRGRATQAARHGRERAERVTRSASSAYAKRPLAAGALAAALGVGVGLMFKSTRSERRTLGPARDRLLSEAAAKAEAARAAAADTLRGVRQDSEDAARQAARSVPERAREAAERHGVVEPPRS